MIFVAVFCCNFIKKSKRVCVSIFIAFARGGICIIESICVIARVNIFNQSGKCVRVLV